MLARVLADAGADRGDGRVLQQRARPAADRAAGRQERRATSSWRWARAGSATSPSCARSRRPTSRWCSTSGKAHIGEFGSQGAIALAKGELVEALVARRRRPCSTRRPAGGGDGRAAPPARVWTFGHAAAADGPARRRRGRRPRARRPSTSPTEERPSTSRSACSASTRPSTPRPRPPPHWRPASRWPTIADEPRARSTGSLPWRMELHERADGLVVINDAYNANPDSMRVRAGDARPDRGALRAAHGRGAGRDARARRAAAEEEHRAVGPLAAAAGDRRGRGRRAGRPGGIHERLLRDGAATHATTRYVETVDRGR